MTPSNPINQPGGREGSFSVRFDSQPVIPSDRIIDSNKGAIRMTDKHADEAKGRVKEAAGSLTDDRSLKNEGKADRGKATIKDKVDKVVDTLSQRNKK
jgi:uncharacterized protein YjbJ (UPF0337 family)